MKTYSTYQECKIANPECEVYAAQGASIFSNIEFQELGANPIEWNLCNPADYCMTVEEFLKDGHKFVEGDVYFHIKEAELSVVGVGGFEPGHANTLISDDAESYILRAAALDLAAIAKQNVEYYSKQISDTAREAFSTNSIPKLKRTKVEFVKVEDSIWHLETDFRCGDLYNKSLDCSGEFVVIKSETVLLACAAAENLYRRIETPMTEEEALAEALKEIWIIDGGDGEAQIERIVNSGKFKLVN